jgi:O-antigen/teichoic acid export membrane protein
LAFLTFWSKKNTVREYVNSFLNKTLDKISILWDFDLADPQSKRRRLIALAAVYNSFARGIAILANLAQVPIALHYLKSEAFGLWITLVGGVQLMGFADLGMGLGLQNKISEAYGRDDVQSVRDFYKTGWLILGAVGLGIAIVGLPLCWFIDWAQVFKIHDLSLKAEVPGALAVILASFCIGLPLNAGLRLAVGMQLGWVAGIWSAVSSVVCLGLIILGKHCDVGFVILVAMAMSAPLIANIGMIVHTFHVLGEQFAETKGRYRAGLPGALLRQGILFLLPQMGAMVMNSAPAVFIASILGTTAVTPFNLCQRLSNALLTIQQLPLTGLWPAYAEAKSRGDHDWVLNTFIKSFWYAAITAILIVSAVIFGGRMAIKIWTNGGIIPSNALVIGFGVWSGVGALSQVFAYFLNGCGELHGQAIGAALFAVPLFLLTPIMLRHFGVSGAVFALIITFVPFGMTPILWSVAKLRKKLWLDTAT